HDLEFMRERHAHRRLGFAREPLLQWIEAPGRELVSAQDLSAGGKRGGNRLTVTLWLAKDRRLAIAGAREVA
ncbi:MAG: ArsR family transcriptional regulator, partial [Bauldia sp.]